MIGKKRNKKPTAKKKAKALKKKSKARYFRKKVPQSKIIGTERIHQESAIEKKIRLLLINLKIDFIQEFKVTYKKFTKYYDFYCYSEQEGWKFIIECDGDYFHARDYHEGTMPHSQLTRVQKKSIKNDQLKNAIAEHYNIPLLRIWEHDINNHFKYVVRSIKKKIADLKKEKELKSTA